MFFLDIKFLALPLSQPQALFVSLPLISYKCFPQKQKSHVLVCSINFEHFMPKDKGSIFSFSNFRKLVLTFRTISLWGQLLPPHHHPWEILKGSRCQNKLLFRERYCAFWKNIEDIEGKGSVAQIYFSIEKHFEQTKYWAIIPLSSVRALYRNIRDIFQIFVQQKFKIFHLAPLTKRLLRLPILLT